MPVAYVITEECVACGTCAEECPAEAIEEGEPYVINEEKCTECRDLCRNLPRRSHHRKIRMERMRFPPKPLPPLFSFLSPSLVAKSSEPFIENGWLL
jgi:ferredoxin